MTVEQLIKALEKLPKDADVVIVEAIDDGEELLVNVIETESFYSIEKSKDVVILR